MIDIGGALWYIVCFLHDKQLVVRLVFFKEFDIEQISLKQFLEGLRLELVSNDEDESNIDPDIIDDEPNIANIMEHYNEIKKHKKGNQLFVESSGFKRAKKVSLPYILAGKAELLDDCENVRDISDISSRKDMKYVIATKGEFVDLFILETEKENIVISAKLHFFNLWSAFITNIAYYCVEKLELILHSEVIRLTSSEIEVLLKLLIISKRYSNTVLALFVMKWRILLSNLQYGLMLIMKFRGLRKSF